MGTEHCPERDPYAFSLRGLTAAASYSAVPALADDRLNQHWDQRLRAAREGAREREPACGMPGVWGRFWLRRRCRAA